MKDGGKVLSSISLGIRNWEGIGGRVGGLLRCIGVGVTRGEENVVDVFDEMFRRQEGHVYVKLVEEKMARAYDGGGLLI